MGRIFKTKIDRFDGRMQNDPRSNKLGACRVVKHFDDYTDKHRLVPHPDTDFVTSSPDAAADLDSFRIQQFIYANSTFFGLGVEAGTTKPKIFQKSAITDAWAASTNGTHASSVALGEGPTIFILYQRYLYGMDNIAGSRTWWKYGDITSSPTFTRALDGGQAYINVISPIVHSKDDIMYFAYSEATTFRNKIGKNTNGTFAQSALTFAAFSTIPSICEYGNYLAIALNTPNEISTVYLWDRDSSFATLSEKIDWGSGTIQWIENIGGVLVGCSTQAPTGLGLNTKIVFKYWTGSEVKVFAEFTTTADNISQFRQKFNNLVYFLAEMTVGGTALRGVWKVVKDDTGLSVSFDRLPHLDDTITAGGLFGFLRTGDYFHIACKNAQDSDKYIVSTTKNQYSTSCIWESMIQNGREYGLTSADTKKLVRVKVTFEPLPAAGAVTLKYKKDAESSFTTIFAHTTDDSISHAAINIESSGATLPQYKEIYFQVVSSGNAVVTGIEYEYEFIDKDI